MSQPGSNFDQRIPGPPFGAPRGPPPAGMQSAPQSGVNPFGLRQRGKNPYAKQPSAFLPPTNQGIGPPPTGPSSFPSQLDPNPTMPFGTMPYQGRTDPSSGSLSWPNSPGGQPPISGSPASLPPVLQPSQQQGNFNLFNPKPQVNGAFEPSEPSPVQSSPSIDSINSRFGRLALDSPTVSSGLPNQRGAQLAQLEGADPGYMDESDEISSDDDSDDNDLTSDDLSSDDAADINGRQDFRQEETLLSQVEAVNQPDANISSNQASQQVVHQNITDSFNQGNFNPLGPGQPLNPPFSAVQSDTDGGALSNFPPSDNILNSFENHGPINLFQGSSTSRGNQVNSNNQQTLMKQQYQSQQLYEKPTSHSTTYSQPNQPPFERTESAHSSHSQSQFERIASQSSINSNHNQSPFDRTDSHSSAGSMAGGSIGGQEPHPSAFKPVLSSRKPNSDAVASKRTTNQLGQVYGERAIGDQSCASPFLPDNSSGSLSDDRIGMGKDSEPSSSDFSSKSSSKSVVENTKYLNLQDHGSSHAQQVDSSMQAPVMPAGFDPQEQSSPAHQQYAGQHENQEPTAFNEPPTTGTVMASFDQQPNQVGLNEIPNQKVTNFSHESSDNNEIDANSFGNKHLTNQTQNTDQSNTQQISQFSPSARGDLSLNAYSGTGDSQLQQGHSGHLPSNTAGEAPISYHSHPLPNAGNNFGITLHNNQNIRDRRMEDSFNARNTGGLNAAQDENRHQTQLLKQDNAACLQSMSGPSIGSHSVEDTSPTPPGSQGFDGQHQQQTSFNEDQQQPSKFAISNQSVQGRLTSQSGNASNAPSRDSVLNPATDFAGRQSATTPLEHENLSQAIDQNQVGVNQPMQPNYETEHHQMQSSSSQQEFDSIPSGPRQDNALISGNAYGAPQQGINQIPLPHQTEQLSGQSALPPSVHQYGSRTQTLVGNAKASAEQTSMDNLGQSQATEPSRELPSSPQKNQDLAGMFSESAASQSHGNTLLSQQLHSNQLNQQYPQLISNSNQSQQNVSRPQLLQENIPPQQNQQESLLRHQGLPQQQYANQPSHQQPGDIQFASQNQQTRQPSSLSSEQDQVQKQPSSMPEQQQPPDNQLQQSHYQPPQMQGNAQMPHRQNIQQFPQQQENALNPQQQQFGIRQFPQQEKNAQLQHGIKQYPQQAENTQQPPPQQQGTNQFLQQQQQNVNQLQQQRENTQHHLQQQQNVNQPPLQLENTLQPQQQQQGFKQFPQAQLQNQEQLPQHQSQPNSLPQQQQADQFDKQQQSSQQQLPQQLPNNQQRTEQQLFSQHQQHEQPLSQSEPTLQEKPQHPQNMQGFPQAQQNVQQGQLTTQQQALNLPLNQQQFNQQLQNRQQFATNGDNEVPNQDRLPQQMQNQAQLPQQSQSQQNLPQQQQNQPQLPPSSQNQPSFSQHVPQQSQNQQQQLPNDNQLPQQQHGQLSQQMQGQQQLPQQVQNQQLPNLGQLPQQQQNQQQLPNELPQQLQNQQQLPHQQQFPNQPQNQQQFPNQPQNQQQFPYQPQNQQQIPNQPQNQQQFPNQPQNQQQFPNQPQNQQQFPNQPQNQHPYMQQQQQNQPQMQNQNDFMRQQQQQLNQQGQQPYFQQNPMQNPALNNPTSSFQNSHYNNMSPSVAAQQMQNYDPRYMQMNQNMQGWNPNANYGQNYNDYYNWYCNMYSNWANYGYGGYGQQFPGQYPGGAGSWDTRSHHSSRSSYVSSRNPSEIDVDSRPSSVLENRPTANDLEIEALEMSKKEISTFQKDSPVEMERLTPLHFYKPHITASFSHFGGCIVVDPNDPNENQTPSVICVPNKNLVTTSELQEFPGPLIRGETSKKSILMFTKTKSRQWLAQTDMKKEFSDSMSLLWDFMTMLIKHNGIIDGPDVAELLMQHKPATDIGQKMGAMLHTPDDVNKIPRTVTEEQYREFLLQGSKKEALDFAVNHDLWGHALILSYKIDPKLHNAVMNKLIASMDNDDSLVSLYGHLSGRGLPSQSCHAVRSGNADWREHLAMLIANPTKNLERDKKNIIVIGDALAEQGNVGAAHLCYLLAGVKLSKCNENGSKICLLGVNHKKENSSRVDLWAKNEFIQLTEIYEFALRQSKNSYIPAFQRMKLLYVNRLYEVGMLAEAFGYCETVAEAVLAEPRSYDLDFLVLFSDVCQRLFYLSMESPEDPEPEWYGRIWRLVELKESNAELSEDWSKSSEPSAPTSSVQTPQHTSRAASSQDSHPEYTNEVTGTSDTQPGYYQPASQGVIQEAAGDSVQETAQHQTVQNVNETNQSEAQQVATDGQWNPNQSNYQTDGNNYGQNQPSYQADYTDGPTQQQDQYSNQQANQYQEQRPDQYQEHQQQPEQYQNQQPEQYQNQQQDQYQNHQQDQYQNQQTDQYQDQQPDWNQQGYTQQEYNQQGYDQQQMQNQMFSPETSYQQYSDQNIQDYGYQAYQDQTSEGLPDSSNQKSYDQQTPADEDDQEDIYDVFGNKKKRAAAKDQKGDGKDDKKVDDSKSKKGENKTDNGKNQQKGWISSFVSKILPNRPKEAFLPDDKDKSIYWDEKKGKYVNKDEPDKPYTPPPPPPTDSQLTSSLKPPAQTDAFSPLPTPASFPSPVVERKRNAPEPNLPTPDSGEQKISPAPSKFSRTAHGIGKRGNRYVNSFSGMHKKDATDAPPAASLFNPMGAPQALPTNFFVPQAPAATNENDDNNGSVDQRPSEVSQRPQNQPPQSQPTQPPRQPQQQPAQQQQPPQQQPTFFNPASMQQNQNSSRNRPRYQR